MKIIGRRNTFFPPFEKAVMEDCFFNRQAEILFSWILALQNKKKKTKRD